MPDPTPPGWHDIADHLRALATVDLDGGGSVHPTVVAYDRSRYLVGIQLRPHPPGAYHDPMIEALALAVPLGADRLAFVCGGRVSSLDDPTPPVTDDGDPRPTAVVVVTVEPRAGRVRGRTSIHRYRRDEAGALVWGRRERIDAAGDGWIGRCLTVSVGSRHELASTGPLEVGRQALRMLRLGHGLLLPPAHGDDRLASALLAAIDSESRGEPQPAWVLADAPACAPGPAPRGPVG